MENASKALIIAGAILLSILIIGLGMRIFSSADSATSGMNLDSQEITAHNSKFNSYDGRQKGSQVTALLTAIQSNNNEYDDRKISVTLNKSITPPTMPTQGISLTQASFLVDNNTANKIADVRKEIKASTTYKVSFELDESGLIVFCGICIYPN